MVTVSVHEAKTHLSRLINRVLAGEEIVIARGKNEIAQIVPLKRVPPQHRIPGWLAHQKPLESKGILDNGFWDPLSHEELGLGPDPMTDPK